MAIPVPNRQLFIDGEWKEPVKKNRIPVIYPATAEIIGDIPAATAEDVYIAVETARGAIARDGGRCWASASGLHRAKYLRDIAKKIRERKSELATLEALDCGKPLDEAASDIDSAAGCFEYYADLAEALDSKQKASISLPVETMKCHVLMEPIGVVGLITPWSNPLLMAAWKVAPALAADCAAILKPSELASITCLELADICSEVGLPARILNILTGVGPEAGAPLVSHPLVDKIAFTGSSATGNKIMSAAAAQLIKPVTLELGGKSPIVIFRDTDLDKELLGKLVEWCQNIKVSDQLEEGCKLGPIVSSGQYEKVMNFISIAKSEGARILFGGERHQHLNIGFFVKPTIIADMKTSMQIWRGEVFGPVLCVKTFANEEEAIELANDTDYGLGAAVLSKDLERCERMIKAFQAGIVWVNCSQPTFRQAPWGGQKRSGFVVTSGNGVLKIT